MDDNSIGDVAMCTGCGTGMLDCDNDPNGRENHNCARCRAEEEHDFDVDPAALFDRQGILIEPPEPEPLVATVDEAENVLKILAAINILREHEGDSVTLYSDNPDFDGPNNIIEASGDWTKWLPVQFGHDTMLQCLEKAVAAKQKHEGCPGPS